MLTQEQNDRITRVGPGTTMGDLMRRYWHPIAASVDLNDENPTKEVRLLGEDLVIFRDTSGRLGCIEPRCAHRKANLSYGIPEEHGLRCPYHGWVYDTNGQCLEQPSEPVGSRFKEKIKLKSYPIEELGGLIFLYMGPEPVPLLPRWDILVWDNVSRNIQTTMLPCNWLQCMDNSLDPVHFEWLHRYFGGWVINKTKPQEEREAWDRMTLVKGRRHIRIGFDRFEHGVIKRRLMDGENEEDAWWRVGHPVLFPNVLRVGRENRHSFQYRIPVDDTHTLHLLYTVVVPKPGEQAPGQEHVPHTQLPLYKEDGRLIADNVPSQDALAWVIQGEISDRPTEALGVTDIGIILYRKIIDEQLRIVEDGGDPMNVMRDPTKNQCIVLPQEYSFYPDDPNPSGPFKDVPIPEPEVDAALV